MKLSYNWLKELVPDLKLSPPEVADLLTKHSFETVVGQRLPADTILEADVTPNRAHDCLSYRGVARELAALLNLTITEPQQMKLSAVGSLSDWTISFADPTHTKRYLGVLLTGIKIQPSPLWLQARLSAVGLRPINNVVDITNYVMLEIGNPAHAFDADRLPSKQIAVRAAIDSEQFEALDSNTYTLSDKNLVITSGDIPVTIAGVIGGKSTEVSAKTKTIFLEVATFAPFTIQQSASSLKLRTESSVRFSKGLAPTVALDATARAIELLQQLAGASVQGVVEAYPTPYTAPSIALALSRPSRVAGVTITSRDVRMALERLRCEVELDGDQLNVTPPPERLDLTGEHDLVEEVIRLHGLEHILTVQPVISNPMPLPDFVARRERLRDQLVTAGFVEIYAYAFENEVIARPLGLVDESSLALVNPIAPEQMHLRRSLLPRLLDTLLVNKAEIRKKTSLYTKSFFEVGTIFRAGSGGIVDGIIEEEVVAGVTVERELTAVQAVIQRVIETVTGHDGITSSQHSVAAGVWDAGFMTIEKAGKVVGRVATISTERRLKLPMSLLRETSVVGFEIYLNFC